jgi:hypothetical protein
MKNVGEVNGFSNILLLSVHYESYFVGEDNQNSYIK